MLEDPRNLFSISHRSAKLNEFQWTRSTYKLQWIAKFEISNVDQIESVLKLGELGKTFKSKRLK